MVVVVVHPILVASRRSHRLNASQESVLDQHCECVVHGLTRDGADVGLDGSDDFVGCHVWKQRHCAEDRDSLRGCLDPPLTKQFGSVEGHAAILERFLD